MRADFRHHDILRLFTEIARHRSFSDAADALHMTKGAISYQIRTLEAALGMVLFRRNPRGVELSLAGQQVLAACQTRYLDIEADLLALRGLSSKTLTIGVSTYFAARWLSPRLMSFMQQYPDIQLRIQPMIRLFDLASQGVDVAIRWGSGRWNDVEVIPFMALPAYPVGNSEAYRMVENIGLEQAFHSLTLLRDHDDSNAWSDWLSVAGLSHKIRSDTLIIPDPNVRVQAVIDGQGIALMDALISNELEDARLFRLSDIELSDYGYFLARPRQSERPDVVQVFVDWLQSQ